MWLEHWSFFKPTSYIKISTSPEPFVSTNLAHTDTNTMLIFIWTLFTENSLSLQVFATLVIRFQH